MTVEQMRERKRELGYSYQKIAQLSGLPIGTVQKVLGGITRSPREETVWALEAVLKPVVTSMESKKQEDRDEALVLSRAANERGKRQGEYTLEDYYALWNRRRLELIDGVFYDMEAPTASHQLVILEIGLQFSLYEKRTGNKNVIFMAPMDVQLNCDNRNMVQPDLFVVCDRGKVQRCVVYGAPDLVVEILSASSRRKDMSIKLSKYSEAGVREYWLVDPDKKRVLVYPLEQVELPVVYSFQDQVPVEIFDGGLRIAFDQIDESIIGL